MRRAFLVGCPRSGTTLLQTMIGANPAVFTVPETHYFSKIRGRLASLRVGPFVSPRAAAISLDALAEISSVNRPDVPRWWPTAGRYITSLTAVLDEAAERQGCDVWVEKSPIHLHHLDEINRGVPGVLFIHLIRDGRDVTASLVDLCERDPERWLPQLRLKGGERLTRSEMIEAAARRWNDDLSLSLSKSNDQQHLILRYDDLIDATRSSLETVCAFLGVPYSDAMERHWEAAERVVGPRKELIHMNQTFLPLEDRRGERFSSMFSADEQAAVTDALTFGGDPQRAIKGRQ